MEELVSICIPVYNGAKTIERALASAVNQTYKNIEIVVVDNCSDDNTVDIVLNTKDERILFFQNEKNIGMAGNWNECLNRAKGKYIHFLCADDTLAEDCIKKKMEMMNHYHDIVIITNSTDIINPEGKCIMHRKRYKHTVIIDGNKFAKKSLHRGNLFGEPSNIMFLKSAIDKSGNFAGNTKYATDWELWIRMAVHGKIGYIEEALASYRVSSDNTTAKLRLKDILDDDRQMLENLKKYEYIHLTGFDIWLHRVVLSIRTLARFVYIKILG